MPAAGHAGSLVEHVAELRRRPGTRRELRRSVLVPGLAVTTASVPEGRLVDLDLELEWIPEGAVATGTLGFAWRGPCRRCLSDVEGVASVELREIFETRPTEGETWLLGVDELDLEPMVRETVLVNLPLAPLCDDACQGPAPEDFPAVPARDEPAEAAPARDPRWAALDDLDLG